ncbi:hypothetical protein JW851_00370 [Candidatus Woesearchaeota archaeon]|nr:hypothetical protein [Candidatus Woesearchaeota archaeon]
MNKKAQGLTITTVVVAILAILVLVVLFYIFTTKTGGLSKQLITCPGDCMTETECNEVYGGVRLPGENYVQRNIEPPKKCSDIDPNFICCSVMKQ